ncbi:unnamed protein product [Alternaria alternata]
MTKLMKKQATVNYKVLDQVEAVKSATLNCLSEDDHFEADKDEKNTGSPKKCVTLSDLLNVIDGVSATGGGMAIRVERAFEISYASKASSITTFKRLFGNDGCERYTSDAITCFAQAFQAQFPSKPSITTVELAKFCGQYRGRPDIAVKEFADWLQRSADNFSYETYRIQASLIRSITMVMSTEPGKLALASPHPNAEDFIVLEQERNDPGFEDFGVDGSDTDKFDTAEE